MLTPDPHGPLVHFVWAHMGWLVVKNRDLTRRGIFERYAKGRVRPNGAATAHYLVGQFSDPHMGLPQLRDR
jgi:hypothetical protein